MREQLLALHAVAAASTASSAPAPGAASAPSVPSSSSDISHKTAVTECARCLESIVRGAMKELQVLSATSTPILQRFSRFFTDILHESCRAIIVNTAIGWFMFAVSKYFRVIFELFGRFVPRPGHISTCSRSKLAALVTG
jgi:hypothetical protein